MYTPVCMLAPALHEDWFPTRGWPALVSLCESPRMHAYIAPSLHVIPSICLHCSLCMVHGAKWMGLHGIVCVQAMVNDRFSNQQVEFAEVRTLLRRSPLVDLMNMFNASVQHMCGYANNQWCAWRVSTCMWCAMASRSKCNQIHVPCPHPPIDVYTIMRMRTQRVFTFSRSSPLSLSLPLSLSHARALSLALSLYVLWPVVMHTRSSRQKLQALMQCHPQRKNCSPP